MMVKLAILMEEKWCKGKMFQKAKLLRDNKE